VTGTNPFVHRQAPTISWMGFVNIDRYELRLALVALGQVFDSLYIDPPRRSGNAAEVQHHRHVPIRLYNIAQEHSLGLFVPADLLSV